MPDSRIDFSDIPESSDEELKRARRPGRPESGHAKRLIAIRIDPRLLTQLRRPAARQSKPYQTFIHEFSSVPLNFTRPRSGKKLLLNPRVSVLVSLAAK